MQENVCYEDNFSSLSNEKLVEYARNSNEECTRILLSRLSDIIKKSAELYLDASLEMDDMEQEGRLACFYAIKNYDFSKNTSFRTYAAVCINNRMLNFIKSKNSKKIVSQSGFTNIDDQELDIPDSVNTTNPENIVIDREQSNSLKDFIEEVLSTLEYKVFLCLLDNMSYDEISRKLSISQKSVDNAVQRLRKKLQKTLE